MEESKQLKVTDLRIGDKVRDKQTGFEFSVIGILWNLGYKLTTATLYLDFEENTGDVWELELYEVEKVEDNVTNN